MTGFYVADYRIDVRCRWHVIQCYPTIFYYNNIQNLKRKAYSINVYKLDLVP